MKILTLLILVGVFASAGMAAVSLNVYRADEQTPLDLADPNTPGVYKDIMVGTKLTVFVKSDVPRDFWTGVLWFPVECSPFGTLSGRNYQKDEDGIGNYVGTCLEAAGSLAQVYRLADDSGYGFDLLRGGFPIAGDWFAFDYEALAPGPAGMMLYASEFDPNDTLDIDIIYLGQVIGMEPRLIFGYRRLIDLVAFNQVPSRDYDADGLVGFGDFAILAGQWHQVSTDPNMAPSSDPDGNRVIDIHDVARFCEHWLERTDANCPPQDPNDVGTGP